MAREDLTRPCDVPAEDGQGDPGDDRAGAELTPAQEHAMRRSAPLTPAQFEQLRSLAARGINPLRRL